MAEAVNTFRPPKPWSLTDNESITSFANWKQNLLYHLSLNNEFAGFLDSVWSKKSVANHGLIADIAPIAEDRRKSSAQKCIILDRMLGLIAQFTPSLLRNDIIKKSTSLSWVWNRVRKYYLFSLSEVNFLKLSSIQRMENERFETLYQRILAHLEDNLLTAGCALKHDGEIPTDDEEMSPTVERLAVLLWLTKIDPRLPNYISRTYAHELQSETLKDIQPRISENLDSILMDMNAQEDIQIQFSRLKFTNSREDRRYTNSREDRHTRSLPSKSKRPSKTTSSSAKVCILCKAAGRNHQGHNIASCWFTSKFEKMEIAKALQVEVDGEEACSRDEEEEDVATVEGMLQPGSTQGSIKRIQSDTSPYFYTFHNHNPCHVVVDTGATSSLVSKSFLKLAQVPYMPTNHSARTVDKTPITVHGEVHMTLQFGEMTLPITALVVDTLGCDILAGVPFCKDNDIQVHLKREEISVLGRKILYGARSKVDAHDIFKAESYIVKSDTKTVIMPGEFLEFESDSLVGYEGEVAIEAHVDSPPNFPSPAISRVIDGRVRIPNMTHEPVRLSKSQHFALIRNVTTPNSDTLPSNNLPVKILPSNLDNSNLITVDPDGLLTSADRDKFKSINRQYKEVFDSTLSAYNDRSGKICANIAMGTVLPPPRKGKLPFYNTANLQLLQDEADKLEAMGVLAKPEDVGVQVKHVSPSFLVKNPSGGHRFVTAFTELGQYTRILPTVSKSCKDVLQKLSSWKYIIKCDLKKSFYQIPVSKDSIPFLGTVTPFKGLRVYLRAAMGMPGSSECLEELITRVFGDFIQKGFFIHIHDDIHVVGNTIEELLNNWTQVLQRLCDNNLKLSAPKTIICPKQMTTLGWVWNAGTLSPSSHKIAPLAACEAPKTCTKMRSFLGAFKALSQCIPRYASLVAPLEDSIKGLLGPQPINWTDELLATFNKVQIALKSPCTLTIPRPSDQLILTVDASPLNNGISATLFVLRDDTRTVAGFFSVKLKEHQIGWMPCEHEALAIASGINHFSSYIRESIHKAQVLSDNKPCVQAFKKLQSGKFSASSRVSTFLSTLSTHNVTVSHLRGQNNPTSDFGSRNPQLCYNSSCQICTFVNELASSVVNAVSVSDVLSGASKMPYLNQTAWKSTQHDCRTLRRVFAHLTQGTRPSKKTKNIKDLKRYLLIASVDNNGLLIVRKTDPFVGQKKLIIVPSQILPGLITAMHLQFHHATKSQLSKLFDRYFYGLNSEAVITNVVNMCESCNALKKMPNEMFLQRSTPIAEQPGVLFSADVLRRAKQKILVTRDNYSSFTTASIIPDEGHSTLRSALLTDTALFRQNSSAFKVDNASGFTALKDDQQLQLHGVTLDFGRVKNVNKNAVADKCIQELETEILKFSPTGGQVTTIDLSVIVRTLNGRIRNRGLSAKEILLQRDQNSGEQLTFADKMLSSQQDTSRQQNHMHSAISKAKDGKLAANLDVVVGELVYVKDELDKFYGRKKYIVTDIKGDHAILQKLNDNLFASRRYEIPLSRIFPISAKPRKNKVPFNWDIVATSDSESDSEAEMPLQKESVPTVHNDNVAGTESLNEEDSDTGDSEDAVVPIGEPTEHVDRPQHQRRPPTRFKDYDCS